MTSEKPKTVVLYDSTKEKAKEEKPRVVKLYDSAKEKAKEEIRAKARRLRNNIITGTLVVGSLVGGTGVVLNNQNNKKDDDNKDEPTEQKDEISVEDERFARIAEDLLKKEGGYADKGTVDQKTNFGIINPTLKAVKEKHKALAELPDDVKDLTQEQALSIIKEEFYKGYKIDKVENESMAHMLLDVVYNHKSNTRDEFVLAGLKAVKKQNKEKNISGLNTWGKKINFINECSNGEQKIFYNSVVKARIDFFNRPGYIDKYSGLKTRAKSFANKFEAKPKNLQFEKAMVMAER